MSIDRNWSPRAQQGASAKLKPATPAGATAVKCQAAPEDDLLVTKVDEPEPNEATFQDTVIYRVTGYNRSPVSESDKRRVRWRVESVTIDSEGKEVLIGEVPTGDVGDTLRLYIPRDCECPRTHIRVYPYIKKWIKRVSVLTPIYCLPKPVPIEEIKQAFMPGKKDAIYTYKDCVYIVIFRNPTEMISVIRTTKEYFEETVKREARLQHLCAIINGVFFNYSSWGPAYFPQNVNLTKIEGEIKSGETTTGLSEPLMFHMKENGGIYTAGEGDPLTGEKSAFGGAWPVIIRSIPFGTNPTNQYNEDVPKGAPPTGNPTKQFEPFVIRRSNATYKSFSDFPPETGKTILAFRNSDGLLALIVQKDGAGETCWLTLDEIRDLLVGEKFDHAVSVDGGSSAMLYARGDFLARQAWYKNAENTMGIGFKCR